MLCGQEALRGRADSPTPTEFTKESWRKDIGLQSQSSGTEVIYCSPDEEWEEEWYEESPEPEPLSPATEQRLHDEFERDIDECTTDSDFNNCHFMSGPEGKTLSEIDEKIADYDRKVKESRMQAMHHHRMEGNAWQYVFATCICLRMPFHRGGGNGGAAARQGRQGICAYQVTGT